MTGEYPWGSDALLAASLRPDGTLTAANATLERFAGRPLAGERFDSLVAAAQRAAFARLLAGADREWRPAVFALQGAREAIAGDHALWLRRDEDDQLLLVAEPAIGEQQRLVEEVLALNADLVAAHRQLVRQRDELQDATERIRHLEAISAAGLAHLRLGDVLDDLLRAVVSALRAERAAVLLPDGSGGMRVEASVGPAAAAGQSGVVEAATRGQPRIGARGAAAPLMADRTVIGVLEVGAGRFGEDDLALLVAASERAAVAISRAQVHERERQIAETLQRALLPARLPEVDGLSFAARYEPAADVDVGGDWYDALPLPSGDVALAIGDVAGKGLHAAAMMGEMRGGLRAYALEAGGPDEVLARLDGLATQLWHEMATVALAMLEPATGHVRYASAGHLPPLLVSPDGSATLLFGGRGAPLLAYRPAGAATVRLEPGAFLVLYTDGLVERRGEVIDDGLARLVRAADGYRGAARPLCDALLARLHGDVGGPRDDTAVIAVQRSFAA